MYLVSDWCQCEQVVLAFDDNFLPIIWIRYLILEPWMHSSVREFGSINRTCYHHLRGGSTLGLLLERLWFVGLLLHVVHCIRRLEGKGLPSNLFFPFFSFWGWKKGALEDHVAVGSWLALEVRTNGKFPCLNVCFGSVSLLNSFVGYIELRMYLLCHSTCSLATLYCTLYACS